MPAVARASLVAAIVIALSGAALAAPPEPRGPAFGQNRYVTSIRADDGGPDVDDYVSGLLEGEVLSVAVMATRGSALVPKLELIGPDGSKVTPPARRQRAGRGPQFSGFRIPQTGRWTVRVSGANSTNGEYAIAFNVRPTGPTTFQHEQLGEDQPLFKLHTFGGLDGAILDFKLTWSSRSNPVTLRSFTDPQGAEVLTPEGQTIVENVHEKQRTLSFSGLPLHEGDGAYQFRVRTDQGAARYDATLSLSIPNRPKAKKPVVLSADEPFLEARATPQSGRPGFVLALRGRHFSTEGVPHVFFGRAEGTAVGVAGDGNSLIVTVPQGVPGTSVDVAVVNPDGQAAVRGGYFLYLQPIAVTDLVDDQGEQVRAGTTRGGRLLHLIGDQFDATQTVLFGGISSLPPTVLSPTEMLVVTPASPAGLVDIAVRDVFGGLAVSSFKYRYKAPPTFDLSPYSPPVTAVGVPVTVTIKGKDFEAADQLAFDGTNVDSTFVSPTRRTFFVPALAAGSYPITLTDSIGSVEHGPDFVVKPPPTIGAVTIIGGPHIGAKGVPVAGGARVQVDGTNFHDTDVTTLAGVAVTYVTHSPTSFTFDSPPGALGAATLAVTDGAGQGTSLANALRYVGYADVTSTRSPRANAVDSLLATHGVIGDLDGDGKSDDLAIVSSYYSVGSRAEATRILFGNANGQLVDRTTQDFPAAGSDSSGTDTWLATSIVVGDVDKNGSNDILIATNPIYQYAYYANYNGTRLFRNTGSGHFVQDEVMAPPSAYAPAVFAYTPPPNSTGYLVFGTVFDPGQPTAMALGDLDKDGDNDLVVARDSYELRYVGIDPTFVNFSTVPPSVSAANATYLSYFQYFPGTRIFDNDISTGRGFRDVTHANLPKVGDSRNPPVPCFRAWDVALGDLDKDGDLDIVETWDDPTTVSAYGTYVGPNIDVPRTATRVLLNSGTAKFTDGTSAWLPTASPPEFWQGRRIALADLDKDSDLDLVILHQFGIDAFVAKPATHTTSALRVLRNDGKTVGFVDVTATAIPVLTGNGDDHRGEALAVRDVDGDGWLDLLVGTTELMPDPASSTGGFLPSSRLFRGGPGLKFTNDTAFLPRVTSDSGEATELLFLGDIAGQTDPSLVLLTVFPPVASPQSEVLRVLDWNR